ncbi:MAG: cell division protein SepF [Oscillospiraceae bacterium]|nr:cell division protein SepF [Oscillospiraceae bacterium]
MPDFLNKLFNKFSSYDDDDYDDDYEENNQPEAEAQEPVMETVAGNVDHNRRSQPKVVNFKQISGQQVIIVKPQDMQAAQEISNHLRAGRTVICNFEQVEQRIAQRIVDFVTGSAYALDGEITPISNRIFVIVPRLVTLLKDDEHQDESMEYLKQAAYQR